MKIKLTFILILTSVFLSGCWDLVEIKDRAIITAFGIDKSDMDGKITFTLQTIIPSRISTPMKTSPEMKPSVRVVSKTTDSFADAIREYAKQAERRTYLMQNRIIIIGEDMAKEGLTPAMDFFMRHPDSFQGAWVLICKGKASEIIKWNSEVERIPADFIEELVKTRNFICSSSVENIHTFVNKLSTKPTSPATAMIELVDSGNNETEARLSGIAVFKKDKMAGMLDNLETKGYTWINNERGRRLFEIGDIGKANVKMTHEIEGSRTKIIPELINGKPAILIKVNATTKIYVQDGSLDLDSQDTLKKLEKMLEEEIKSQIEACLNKALKEYKTDIFGFGEKIHRKYPKEWKKFKVKWEDALADLKVITDVNVKTKSTGMIIDTIKP
ncbi:Ger(x)C family spore germination protein [Lutispora sp.]|uniref:Ger(x)C family spore germination protein n=1 Tax=Lutispora sp. TaxID=2828727 RepID=UPI000ED71226|nr:Ger(x)C family spore germination protein [Lutispora sp.]MEA4960775.1 Ger(x)C family spore germination protein [Lutispora sp.]HCJ56541.1 hypothetical protein [Clostridiaceae bacterium]